MLLGSIHSPLLSLHLLEGHSALLVGGCTTDLHRGTNLVFLLLEAADSMSVAVFAAPLLKLCVRWICKEC